MLHDANLKLFSPASPHYERAAETSAEIMARYKAAFDAARIAPARWNVGGQISPAYGMPKFKSFKDGYDDSPPARQAGARAEPGCHCSVAGCKLRVAEGLRPSQTVKRSTLRFRGPSTVVL